MPPDAAADGGRLAVLPHRRACAEVRPGDDLAELLVPALSAQAGRSPSSTATWSW